MGYTTEFTGKIKIEPAVTLEEYKFLEKIYENDSREHTSGWPDSYLQWIVDDTGSYLRWDGNEKFYYPVEWMKWIVNYLGNRGHMLNGELEASGEASGEDMDDRWKLVVENNNVKVFRYKQVIVESEYLEEE